MQANDLSVEIEPCENADWGFARNKRVLLRRPNAEFSQSVFSTRVGRFTAPNRDYPYEGFSGFVGGENWKFLDAIFFALKLEGNSEPVELTPIKVTAWPWKAEYVYSFNAPSASGLLEAEYYLLKRTSFPSLSISFKAFDGRGRALNGFVAARPFVDIRHIYSPSKPWEHAVQVLKRGLLASRAGKSVFVYSPSAAAVKTTEESQKWWYKLGDGSRRTTSKGIEFAGEEHVVSSAGEIELALERGRCDLFAACGFSERLKPIRLLSKPDEAAETARLQLILNGLADSLKKAREAWGSDFAKALAARTLVLLEKFWVDADASASAGGGEKSVEALDAGFGWFRSVWWRDVFEAVLQNFGLFARFHRRELKKILAAAIGLQNKGLIPLKQPAFVGEKLSYEAVDATLLCLLAAAKFARRTSDKKVEKLFYGAFTAFLNNAESNARVKLVEGLVACPARWSWVDSFKRVRTREGEVIVPARIPSEWVEAIGSKPEVEEFSNTSFFLLEVNAQWIALLKELLELKPPEDVADRARELLDLASYSFKERFFVNDSLSHVACDEFGAAAEASSAAFEALAFTPWLFSETETKAIVDGLKKLFVKRGSKLFGALLKDVGSAAFFGDDEYHGRVVWPRETPYLAAVLNRLGEAGLVEQLLLSNLEHQMQEGAVFYNHELFSLTEGINPSHSLGAESLNPVPVKNPAQLWSQWTQAYYDLLEKRR